jgi:hypothetical protein
MKIVSLGVRLSSLAGFFFNAGGYEDRLLGREFKYGEVYTRDSEDFYTRDYDDCLMGREVIYSGGFLHS